MSFISLFYKVNGISIELSHKPISLLFHRHWFFAYLALIIFFTTEHRTIFKFTYLALFNLHFNPELLQKLLWLVTFLTFQCTYIFVKFCCYIEHKWHICNIACFSIWYYSWLNSERHKTSIAYLFHIISISTI